MITINDYAVNVTFFPDGTSQVWKLDLELFRRKKFFIKWVFDSEAEIMVLQQLVDLVRNSTLLKEPSIELYMPFLPYGRQDKEVTNSSTFALHSFAKIINGMELTTIRSLDTHSSVAGDLINNFENITPHLEIESVALRVKPDVMVFPDAGAVTRDYNKFLQLPTATGTKTRDPATGYISNYEVTSDVDLPGKCVLVIDDLCDGGMTFILLAKKLKSLGCKSIILYTTHGLYTKGIQVLFDAGIDRIFSHEGER